MAGIVLMHKDSTVFPCLDPYGEKGIGFLEYARSVVICSVGESKMPVVDQHPEIAQGVAVFIPVFGAVYLASNNSEPSVPFVVADPAATENVYRIDLTDDEIDLFGPFFGTEKYGVLSPQNAGCDADQKNEQPFADRLRG